MPLHLLGKKSWNVYNADNIERVKRDEAAAAAREAAEEQRMQEVDAERRIQILRGIREDQPLKDQGAESTSKSLDEPSHRRKRRRLAGEDDTDRDLRIARENNEDASKARNALVKSARSNDAPLTDHKGNINLFPMESSRHRAPKNAEAEAEAAKKKKEFEDQYTMRFSNAAGLKQSVDQKPWYSSAATASNVEETVSKDVWGNEDPRRKEREQLRLASDDPMAIIQKGVSELRKVDGERQRWKEEKDRELKDLVASEKRQKLKRHRRRTEDDDLHGFNLDAPLKSRDGTRPHHRRHHHRTRE
ncbi:MAG: hypothetical protein Q9191_000668 [Dirinaria sp. TL-2023a]